MKKKVSLHQRIEEVKSKLYSAVCEVGEFKKQLRHLESLRRR